MIDTALARLREPRLGMVFVTGVIALLMAGHWAPMALPAIALLGLALVRPEIVVRPFVAWVMAASWFAAILVVPEHMEDHVPLFAVWLVALAVSLTHEGDAFIDQAAWQARALIGVTFGAAVAWKLYFGTYLNGVTLWTFMLADGRFQPLATMVGLDQSSIEQDRVGLTELLAGARDAVPLEASTATTWIITAAAVLTLALEATIAVSHLMPDSSKLARLRLPSVVFFGVVTYGVVPVLPFAALLALLSMSVARWRPEIMWVFPAMVLIAATRLAVLSV